jgi:hypothetical protein
MKRTKRYEVGGEVDPLEAANQSTEAQEIAGEAILKGMRDAEIDKPSTFKEAFAAARKAGDKTFEFGGKKYSTEMASSKPAKVTDSGDESARLASRYKAPTMRQQETMQDRAERYVAKRAAQRAEDAAANAVERARMPTSKPRASEQTFMGSLKFSKGGSTASKRADGIAIRGKTKGRIV